MNLTVGAAWPRVQAKLVELLPTLPSWSEVDVSDGPPDDQEAPYQYCTVGSTVYDDFGGTYEQSRTAEGGWDGAVQEIGQVRCELVVAAREDDLEHLTDVAAVRDAAFALVDEWDAALYADPTMGVLGPLTTLSLAVDVQPMQTDRGAVQRLVISVGYVTFF